MPLDESLEANLFDYALAENPILASAYKQSVLFMNSPFSQSLLPFLSDNDVMVYNPIKRHHQQLKDEGVHTSGSLAASMQPESVDRVYVCLSKNKEENLFHIGLGLFLLKAGGLICVYGRNDNGAQRYEKDIHKAGIPTENIFKYKGRVFWGTKGDEVSVDILRKWIGYGQTIAVADTSLVSVPGLFSAEKVDKGSKILTEHLPETLSGLGADFGCGYGFLSHHVLSKGIAKRIICVDHDSRALDCASENLKDFVGEDYFLNFSWTDLVNEDLPKKNLEWIVMNPPFHDDKVQAASIGQIFIQKAAFHLKDGGMFYMVANQHLPYEKVLEASFSSVSRVFEGDGYKVYAAKK